MDLSAQQLMEEALRQKRAGNPAAAKQCYRRAIAAGGDDAVLYYGLAKVNYLLGEREEAISNYLRAAHLSFNSQQSAVDGAGLAGELVREQIDALPEELLAALREISVYAPLLMLDDNLARNLGHALIDLTPGAAPGAADVELYRRSLQGEEDVDEDTWRALSRLQEEVYLPRGREYLADNILWEMIGDDEVHRMY